LKRVKFFYDGFNLYHGMMNSGLEQYRWLDLIKFSHKFMSPKHEKFAGAQFFTAPPFWNQSKTNRHQLYCAALKSTGVEVTLGKFQKVQRKCRAKCRRIYDTHEEKHTDCNMVSGVLGGAAHDEFDTAIIVSADSDLMAAVNGLKRYFPEKKLGFVFPQKLKSYHLGQEADFVKKAHAKHFKTFLLPDTITLDGGKVLYRPVSWK